MLGCGMNALIAILFFVLGAIAGSVIASGFASFVYAVVSVFRGKLIGLLALLWPIAVWFVILPLLLLAIGSLGDHWGYKFQIFGLIGAGLVGVGNLLLFSFMAFASALDKR